MSDMAPPLRNRWFVLSRFGNFRRGLGNAPHLARVILLDNLPFLGVCVIAVVQDEFLYCFEHWLPHRS
jgi:hypothetical protein